MITRLILRLPWFISTPAIVAAAVLLAVGANVVAGTYFERSFLDDVDPFAGFDPPPESAAARGPFRMAGGSGGTAPAPAAVVQPSAAPTLASPPTAALPAAIAPVAGPVLLSEGAFVDGDPGHNGEGTARLIRGADGGYLLRLEDFSVTNGPDLFVILSADPAGSRGSAVADAAVNLGRLRATDGNINYDVPADLDPTAYRSVIIYCRAFKVVFAVATLELR